MFVVRFGINGKNTDYYFNNIRKARLFERKILLIVYDDTVKNAKTYHDLYFFIKDIKNTLESFDYNCDNDELKKWILQHENNEYYFDIESYVEEIQTLD